MSNIAGQPKVVAKTDNPEPGYHSITPLQQEYEEVALNFLLSQRTGLLLRPYLASAVFH